MMSHMARTWLHVTRLDICQYFVIVEFIVAEVRPLPLVRPVEVDPTW